MCDVNGHGDLLARKYRWRTRMLQSAGRVLSLSVEGVSLASGSTNVESTSVAESEHTKTVRVLLGSYLVVCGSPWAHAGKRPTAELIWLSASKLTIPRTVWPTFQLILPSTVRVCRCVLMAILGERSARDVCVRTGRDDVSVQARGAGAS